MCLNEFWVESKVTCFFQPVMQYQSYRNAYAILYIYNIYLNPHKKIAIFFTHRFYIFSF